MNSDVEKYLINENSSIRDALIKVEKNHYGFIFSCNDDGKVIGLATDGDMRRGMIKGLKLDDPISKCVNTDFVSVQDNVPRERLIKGLDSNIKFIPILDDCGRLTTVISKDYLPLQAECGVYIRSRAPVRVSFGGGGSDLTHFFKDSSGAVINTAISIYSHATMRVRDDLKININSFDIGEIIKAENLDEFLSDKSKFGLFQSILHVVKPKFGFDLYINSDFPVGSGLGGSSTVSAAILGCFNMTRVDPWSQHEIAEIAFQAERLHLGIAGGWQDQYASVFGGFNFIEFNADENIINPIRIHPDICMELEESLVLCDTGKGHNSGDIHLNQKETMSSESVRKMVKSNVELSYSTRNHLLRGELIKFGECLNKAWQLKRNFSNMISNKYIDSIYNEALNNGATGGKLLGAGGGGFFIFYVPPFKKHDLLVYLKSKKLKVHQFRFEKDGLKAWKVRDLRNKSSK